MHSLAAILLSSVICLFSLCVSLPTYRTGCSCLDKEDSASQNEISMAMPAFCVCVCVCAYAHVPVLLARQRKEERWPLGNEPLSGQVGQFAQCVCVCVLTCVSVYEREKVNKGDNKIKQWKGWGKWIGNEEEKKWGCCRSDPGSERRKEKRRCQHSVTWGLDEKRWGEWREGRGSFSL